MQKRILGNHDMAALQARAMNSNLADRRKIIPAVVLIDMYSGHPIVGTREESVEKMRSLSLVALKKGVPVAIVEMGDEKSFPAIASLGDSGAEVIKKTGTSAFSNILFTEFLEKHGANTLIVGGYNFLVCVLATLENASFIGYDLYSSKDILFTRNSKFWVSENQEIAAKLRHMSGKMTIYDEASKAMALIERLSKENRS